MIEYIAIYLAIGIVFSAIASKTEPSVSSGILAGFLWPGFILIMLFVYLVSGRRR